MNLRQQLRFAARQLAREWRGGALTVLLLALVVAIASHTAIAHFTARISATMADSANDIIGGDLVLSSGRPVQAALLERAAAAGLRQAQAVQFPSVINAGDEILLVGVKAVDAGYPLKGSVKTAAELYGQTRAVKAGPAPGEAWVEARVFHELQLAPGDAFELGSGNFTASRILAFEPDRGRNFYSFTPRVLINAGDLEGTGILQPGSRVRHRHMFAGPAPMVAAYRAWLEPRLQPGQHVHGLGEERPGVAEALDKAQQYMGLASLVALLLAAVAIAASGRHYSERHYDTSALLRCMGCKQRDILVIYLAQLLLLAVAGGVIGGGLGYLAQAGLLAAIAGLLPEHIAPAAWSTFGAGLALAVVVLIGFTLPSVVRLKSVPPQRVLRSDLAPLPASAWAVFSGAAALVAAMMWYYTGNLTLTVGVMAGAAAVLAVTAALLSALFRLLDKMLPGLPVKIRAGLRNLVRRRRQAASQTMAFGLTIMAMLVVVFIRTELVSTWQRSIPDNAPNHFVLNIQNNDAGDYARHLRADGIDAGQLYPVVRGRLTRLNGRPMVEHVSKEERHNESLRRDLNLTWSRALPPDNAIVAGDWWGDGETAQTHGTLVSVEFELAEDLSIDIGDRLTLFTGEQEWQAQVASIRSVQWDNFKPNFYLVFNPGALDHLPVTHINSFHIDAADKRKLAGLVKRFPSITVLEMDAILNQVTTIISQVTLAAEAILAFVLAAGVVVTLAAIASSMDERLREGALLRTLGAERKLLRRSQWSEFAGMGLVSGLLGVLGAEIVNMLLYQRVFELEYAPATGWAWLAVPLLSAVLIGYTGVASSRRVLRHSPAAALRRG